MKVNVLDHNKVLDLLPDRAEDAHKGNFGRIYLLCGSRGYTGAAYLAAMGALRCGAGLVYLGVPESIYEIEAVKLNEPIVFPLPDRNGMFSATSIPEILERLLTADAVLIGPGMGQSSDTYALTRAVLEHAACPVILDADGINVICQHKDVLRGRTQPTILTPHDGEFARLEGKRTNDRVEAAVELADSLGCIVVRKGKDTVITDGETIFLNPTGNPGMATGGSGDVLAGMITTLVGQGMQPLKAAACGAWIHGAAGDICAAEMGQYAMLPTDMLNVLPRLLK